MGQTFNNADDLSPKDENAMLYEGNLSDSLNLYGGYPEVLDSGIWVLAGKLGTTRTCP